MDSSSIFERKAIDPTGNVGYFYDLHCDRVLEQSTVGCPIQKNQLYESIRCKLLDTDIKNFENVFEKIDIDGDIRINMLLQPKSRAGISAIIDHPSLPDKYTRILHIYYVDREHKLPEDTKKPNITPKATFRNAKCAHIITAVKSGVEVIVVLQVSPKETDLTKINAVLQDVRQRLEDSNSNYESTNDYSKTLDDITRTTVYSNVSEITEMTSVSDICKFMKTAKNKGDMFRPLSYTVRSITWLYSDATSIPYYPLRESDIKELEQYLIKISNEMKSIKSRLSLIEGKLCSGSIKDALVKVQDESKGLQPMFNNEIERITNVVYNVRTRNTSSTVTISAALKEAGCISFKTLRKDLLKQLKQLENDVSTADSSKAKFFEDDNLLNSQRNQSDYTNGRSNEDDHSKASPVNTTCPPTQDAVLNDDTINILLLGESGVGKSTFINAFVNYLTFETLKNAESGKPIVLIPVSYLITTGDTFQEHIVQFGDFDETNNEDFEHPGQSVTQHCRSYVFTLKKYAGRKLRIIDTPGFGDTRGIDQDAINMQHIIEYITNFKHVDAICFLLKPNVSRMNDFFASCLRQILDTLGLICNQKIIFCFTKSRSTFYSPGDTAPLLRKILGSLKEIEVPFNKDNTFCFDNEAFRYLVAVQKLVTFDVDDKEEYKNSWLKSVDESNRLLDYIYNRLSKSPNQINSASLRHTGIQITYMVRPMLQAMRNILRNIILIEMKSPKQAIILNAKAVSQPSALCFMCKRKTEDFVLQGNFWILKDVVHTIRKKCADCICDVNQHRAIDCTLEYQYLTSPSNYDAQELKVQLKILREASVEFAYFLMHVTRSFKDDPFSTDMMQMTVEESETSARNSSNELNSELLKRLRGSLDRHEEFMNKKSSVKEHPTLSAIREQMGSICNLPMIKTQMNAVKESRKAIMKLYEYEVPEKSNVHTEN